jgi:hypothetical protein
VDRYKTITIEFLGEERTETMTTPPNVAPANTVVLGELSADGAVFNMEFRGNTLVGLTPPRATGSWLYRPRPAQIGAKEAPMKEVTRYVTSFQLRW